jgi:hypothetical protein
VAERVHVGEAQVRTSWCGRGWREAVMQRKREDSPQLYEAAFATPARCRHRPDTPMTREAMEYDVVIVGGGPGRASPRRSA